MDNIEITAYLKTHCGWSRGIRAVLTKYNVPYQEKDIIKNPEFRFEMEQLSGQPLSPCVIVNGTMLADISGEELEGYLLENGLVGSTDKSTDIPLNAPCSDQEVGRNFPPAEKAPVAVSAAAFFAREPSIARAFFAGEPGVARRFLIPQSIAKRYRSTHA